MDRIQQPLDCTASTRRTFTFSHLSATGVPGTHFNDLGKMKAESTVELPLSVEPKTPRLVIQRPPNYAKNFLKVKLKRSRFPLEEANLLFTLKYVKHTR